MQLIQTKGDFKSFILENPVLTPCIKVDQNVSHIHKTLISQSGAKHVTHTQDKL